jgi:hypothetical protein
MAVVSLALVGVMSKYWDKLNQKSSILLAMLMFFISSVVYPLLIALRRHRRINDLFAAGYIAEQIAGSPLDEVLDVADNAVNEGFFDRVFVFGIALVVTVLWKLA